MTDFDKDNQRIYLYSHSPEIEKSVGSGALSISTGGARRPDGTLAEMGKPLSFTLDELKTIVSDEEQLITMDERVNQLSSELQLSQEGLQELTNLGWLNNTAINQVYSMTYAGFRQTLMGLEYISAHVDELRKYIGQRDINDLKERVDKYLGFLESDAQRLRLSKVDVSSNNVEEHLNEIAAFIRREYDGLMAGIEDGFFACMMVNALIYPFTEVLMKYAILFYYECKEASSTCNKCAQLIYDITSNPSFWGKLEYYIRLNTSLPFQDKLVIAQWWKKRVATLPDYLLFNAEYTLYHDKDEYLSMDKKIKAFITSQETIPDDRKIYL